ncbi:hypothetical protein SLS53_008359 [Cytospora paraplurivora]|uniref:Zn(2)-C6 fungal-type domain-containing protein n=1 Tax=Cytospora paraplurivora TaxID=2898453 RepID=A0AAN9U0I7_9PEZI
MQRRSRNGCIDCRKSKVKCDEIRPFCGTCTRRQHICQGYATPPPPIQKAPKTGKHDRRDSDVRGRDEATIEVYFERHPCDIIIGPEFVNEMNANVLKVLQHNPHAIVDALSAIGHCYLNDSTLDSSLVVLNYRARILATLRAMELSRHILEEMILLLLGLCGMELVDSRTAPSQSTLPIIIANAASLINHHVSTGREVSSLARYFIRGLARQDMVISLVQMRRMAIPSSVWLDGEAKTSADRLMGYTSTLMPLLEELCALAEDVRHLLEDADYHVQQQEQQQFLLEETPFESPPPYLDDGFGGAGVEHIGSESMAMYGDHDMFHSDDLSASFHHHNSTAFHPQTSVPTSNTAAPPDRCTDYLRRADELRVRIELWKPSLPHGMSFRQSRRYLSQASCYRSGALLYLFRLLNPAGAPSTMSCPRWGADTGPTATDGEATAMAHDVLMATNSADGDDIKMLLWPVFFAACEMSAPEDRRMVLDMFDEILARRRTVTAQRIKEFVLNRVWAARDEGRQWNWAVLARQFPGECLPI